MKMLYRTRERRNKTSKNSQLKNMYKVEEYRRLKNNQRGELITSHKYPTRHEANNAAFALKQLSKKQVVYVPIDTECTNAKTHKPKDVTNSFFGILVIGPTEVKNKH